MGGGFGGGRMRMSGGRMGGMGLVVVVVLALIMEPLSVTAWTAVGLGGATVKGPVTKSSGGAATVKLDDVAPVRPWALNASKCAPVPVMVRSAKVA